MRVLGVQGTLRLLTDENSLDSREKSVVFTLTVRLRENYSQQIFTDIETIQGVVDLGV